MNPAARGEVWFADLGEPRNDHEQAGRRPVVILQADDLSPLSTVVIIPFTTKTRKAGLAHTVLVPAQGQDRNATQLPSVPRFAHLIAAS
jgi:mRNA-degrading endonuclease toxin of MazEF toxin-antitoxin module